MQVLELVREVLSSPAACLLLGIGLFPPSAVRTGTYGVTPDSFASFERSLGPIRCIRVPGLDPHICQ